MKRPSGFAIACVPLLAAFAILLGPAVWNDLNFIYRDAGHFYYPYFRVVADQMNQGKVPLWCARENSGCPLAANPTAAVFYPPKLLFAILPYGKAYFWFHAGHVLLAGLFAMLAARGWGASWAGASLAGVSYAYSGFVFFQVYNIPFLVGAAWLPLGIAAVGSLIERPSARAACLLGTVLAMQTLGGDPQTAYLTVLLAGIAMLYAHHGPLAASLMLAGLLAIGSTIVQRRGIEFFLADQIKPFAIDLAWPLMAARVGWVAVVILTLLAVATPIVWRVARSSPAVRSGVIWLIVAAALSAGLSAVQVLPTMEYVGQTDRAAPDAPHEPAAFSYFPIRVLEFFVPALFGKQFPFESRWMPLQSIEGSVWHADGYMGMLVGVLALTSMRFVRADRMMSVFLRYVYPVQMFFMRRLGYRWRTETTSVQRDAIDGTPGDRRTMLLSWCLVVALVFAAGKFAGFAWLKEIGRVPIAAINHDPALKRYGDTGGLYWLAENTLPGFRSFRYPSKFFVFAAACVSLLAGLALDRALAAPGRLIRGLTIFSGCCLVTAAAVWLLHGPVMDELGRMNNKTGLFGPFAAHTAWQDIVFSLVHAGIVAGMCAALFRWATDSSVRGNPPNNDQPKDGTRVGRSKVKPATTPMSSDAFDRSRSGMAAWLLVAVTTIEIAVAQRWMVLLDRQAALDDPGPIVAAIKDHDRQHGDGQPYRIHRVKIWAPFPWLEKGSVDRIRELTSWERRTIQPKYAMMHGMDYVHTVGTMGIYDYEFFFGSWVVNTPPPLLAAMKKAPPRMIYFPRASLDVWNTRYFVVPAAIQLDDEDRGIFTLLTTSPGAKMPMIYDSPPTADDVRVYVNTQAMPRSWLVHQADFRTPIDTLERQPRRPVMEELVFRSLDGGLPLWQNADHLSEFPYRERVMLEPSDPAPYLAFASGASPLDGEQVRMEPTADDAVRLVVTAKKPGFVVVANTFYPGWTATVDGKPADILRANRAMRAVPVPAGNDMVIEMRYRCRPFEIGAAITLGTLVLMIGGLVVGWLRSPAIVGYDAIGERAAAAGPLGAAILLKVRWCVATVVRLLHGVLQSGRHWLLAAGVVVRRAIVNVVAMAGSLVAWLGRSRSVSKRGK